MNLGDTILDFKKTIPQLRKDITDIIFNDGLSAHSISKQVGITHPPIYRILRGQDVSLVVWGKITIWLEKYKEKKKKEVEEKNVKALEKLKI